MRSYPSWIAGLEYESPDGTDRQAYCAGLWQGALLQLKPEPDNIHDAGAVKLLHEGCHVGYVPRRHAWVGGAIDEGKQLECHVVDVEITGGMFRRKRAEHVETRISVIANVDPRLVVEQQAVQRAVRMQREKEDGARKCCAEGLRVLAYLATVDGFRSPEEHNIEISVIESRLITAGFDRDPELLAMLADQAAALSIGKGSMTRAVNLLSKDEGYFRLIYAAASELAGLDGQVDAKESEVFGRLTKAGKANGWL